MTIQPNKPTLYPDYYCSISLHSDQTKITKIKKIAQLANFREQTQLHITIIGGETHHFLENKSNNSTGTEKQELLKNLETLLNKFDWQYEIKEFSLVSKIGRFGSGTIEESRQSYIQTIYQPDLTIFYQQFNQFFGTDFLTQFPHITLYTKGERKNTDYYGIPISSLEEFNKLSPTKIL